MGVTGQSRRNLRQRTDEDAAHDEEAVRLRALGLSYTQIAAAQNCARSTAYQRVQRSCAAVPVEAVNELRTIELGRLDMLIAEAWKEAQRFHPYISNGRVFPDIEDVSPKLAARREIRMLSESRRKLLGLDAPTQHDIKVVTDDELNADIERLIDSLLAVEEPPAETTRRPQPLAD